LKKNNALSRIGLLEIDRSVGHRSSTIYRNF
jgi:hypothetical protein